MRLTLATEARPEALANRRTNGRCGMDHHMFLRIRQSFEHSVGRRVFNKCRGRAYVDALSALNAD